MQFRNILLFSVLFLTLFTSVIYALDLTLVAINPSNNTWLTGNTNYTINFTVAHSNTTANITAINITNANFTFYTNGQTAISTNLTNFACSVTNATSLNCSNTTVVNSVIQNGVHVNIGINRTTTPSAAQAINHTWNFRVADNASTPLVSTVGSQVSQVDGANPTYTANTNNSVAGNYSKNTGNLSVSYNFSDNGSGILNNTWALTNASGNQPPSATLTNITGITYNVSGVHDGVYNITLQFFDNANNSNWTNATIVTIDNTNPTISYNTTTDTHNANLSRNWIFVNLTLSDTNFRNVTYYLYWQNGTLTNNTTYSAATATINWTGLADGRYTFNVTTYDAANNTNSTSSRNVTLDRSSPEITITLDKQEILASGIIKVTCAVSDSLDSSPSAQAKITEADGQVHTSSTTSGSTEFTFKDLQTDYPGTATVSCTSVDDAGNTNTVSKTLKIVNGGSGGSGGSGGGSGASSPASNTTTDNKEQPVTSPSTTPSGTPTPTQPSEKESSTTQEDTTTTSATTGGGFFTELGEDVSNILGGALPGSAGLGVVSVLVALSLIGGAGYLVYRKVI